MIDENGGTSCGSATRLLIKETAATLYAGETLSPLASRLFLIPSPQLERTPQALSYLRSSLL